jgi:carboxyl-terminal processing protease
VGLVVRAVTSVSPLAIANHSMAAPVRASVAALLLLATPGQPVRAQSASYEELQWFSAVLNHLRSNYPDSVTYRGLVRAAVDGMLRSLDPHSWFATQEDYEGLSALERGELAETGIVLEVADGVPTVLTCSPRSMQPTALQP